MISPLSICTPESSTLPPTTQSSPVYNKCLLCPRRTFKEACLQQCKQVRPLYSIACCEKVFELNTRRLLHRKPHLARFGPCRFELHMNTRCLEALDHPFCHPLRRCLM